MTTDEEKNKLSKLLQDLEVQEFKLPERCNDLLKEFRSKFSKDEEDNEQCVQQNEISENPYRVDPHLLEGIEKKLRELLSKNKSSIKQHDKTETVLPTEVNKPWRTNSNKEKLLRINCELKRHLEKASEMILPLSDGEMKDIIEKCTENSFGMSSCTVNKLRATVEAARKDLPNFQYRNIENSTATDIMRETEY